MTKKKPVKADPRWEKTRLNNLGYIPKISSTQTLVSDFARIRSWGDKNSAITFDNERVERQEYLYADGYGLVKCINYELHFVYEDKSKKVGRWVYMCTCGSIAGIVSYNEMKSLMTVQGIEKGYVFVCISHTATKQNTGIGKHADGSTE